MIYSRDKKQIRERYAQGMGLTEIQKSFPKKVFTLNEISDIVKKFNRLEWSDIDGVKHLKCNTCYNIKPYTYEYYQVTEKSTEKKCRVCRNLIRRNKRRLDKNLGKKNIKNLHDNRRWWRNKLIRIIDINYYKTTYKPKYIKHEKDLNYFRRKKFLSNNYHLINKQGLKKNLI